MKINTEDFLCIVDNEGLAYTITEYFDPQDLEDQKLRELATEAKEALEKLQDYVEEIEK